MALLFTAEMIISVVTICLVASIVECRPKTASQEIEEANEHVDFKKIKFDKLFTKYVSLSTSKFVDNDELLTAEQVEEDERQTTKRTRRALLRRSLNRTWNNNVVSYSFDEAYSSQRKNHIKFMMRKIELVSCVRFKEVYSLTNMSTIPVVFITPHFGGCWSTVGKSAGNFISLDEPKCFQNGVILHELLHVLGFRHEQSRPDRDQYVKIIWENIKKERISNFEKRADTNSLGENYDIRSIMHYHSTAFSKNGKATLESKNPHDKEMGSNSLTAIDIKQLNLLYNCPPSPRRRYGYKNC